MSIQQLDPDIHACQALVIDGNPTSRSALVSMLRSWGVGLVVQVARPYDARRILENRRFDIVLCEQYFDAETMGGQDLLDDLRRSQLLPFSTVFVMVTGEASYAKVAEAAESALDSYLLKPHNAAVLGERLRQARRRKKMLQDIFLAIDDEDYAQAARLCLTRFAQRSEYWLYAARIGAELLLRLGQHDAARKLFEAVRETRALPWARLGIARAHADSGNAQQARRTLESLLTANPSYADAHDVMGRVQIEQGDLPAALDTFRRACALTPASVSRLQKQGMLAFYAGDSDEAERTLERAMIIGISAKTFDLQTLMVLALLKFDRLDTRGLQRASDNLDHALEKSPGSPRLERFQRMFGVLRSLLERQSARTVQQIRALAGEIGAADFDFEAASNFCALIDRLGRTELRLPEADDWLKRLAERFCVSKTSADLLAATLPASPDYAQIVREAHGRIILLAEAAISHSARGAPDAAVQSLLLQGRENLNAKLIELAVLVLQRHGSHMAEHATLTTEAEALRQRYCAKGTRLNLVEAGRAPGAMVLRAGRRKTDTVPG
ncbi:MAG: tetratricopeptide repeat protein [Leptothrix sp. (in: b-proteobacteria)]